MLGLFKKKKKKSKPPGQNQPSLFDGAADFKDLIAPSSIKEIDPVGKDYWVEVGGTNEFTRYFRSYYATLTGGSTYAGMLNPLFLGDFGEADCDIALHVTPADATRTLWELEQRIAQLETEYQTENNSARRQGIAMQVEELRHRHAGIRTGVERPFFVSIQALVSSVNFEAFKRFCNLIVKKFGGRSIHLRSADTRQLEALIQMTPLDQETIKDPFRDMESSNVADLLPFGIGGIRHKNGIVLGVDPQHEIILYDAWHYSLGNYNECIFGRSGFGKSFLVKLIAARSVPLGIETAIIDPENEYENLMVGLGCPYIKLLPSSKDRINIFDVEEAEDEDGTVVVDIDGAVQAAQAVVFKMIRVYDPDLLTGQVKVMLQEKIKQLYSDRGITEDPTSLYESGWQGDTIEISGKRKAMPTLSDLHDLIEKEPELSKIELIVKAFTRKGGSSMQSIFDCQSTVNITGLPAFAFSVAGLDDDIMKPLGLFVATKWTWEKLGRDRRRRKRIVVDEAQLMMDTPETADWLENAYRRARRRNISMCSATQGFEVFLRVPQGLGILKNSSTKFLLKQESVDIAAVQEKFVLSEGEATFLINAKKGWGIVKVDTDASVFYGKVMDEEYAWFTSDPNDLIAFANKELSG